MYSVRKKEKSSLSLNYQPDVRKLDENKHAVVSPIQRHTHAHTPLPSHPQPPPNTIYFFVPLYSKATVFLHYLYFLPFCLPTNTLYFTKSSLVKIASHLHVAKSNGHYSVRSVFNLPAAFNIIDLPFLSNDLLSWLLGKHFSWLSFYLSVYSYFLCRLFFHQIVSIRPRLRSSIPQTLHTPPNDLIHSHGFTYHLYIADAQVSIFTSKALFQTNNHLLDNSTCISHK